MWIVPLSLQRHSVQASAGSMKASAPDLTTSATDIALRVMVSGIPTPRRSSLRTKPGVSSRGSGQ